MKHIKLFALILAFITLFTVGCGEIKGSVSTPVGDKVFVEFDLDGLTRYETVEELKAALSANLENLEYGWTNGEIAGDDMVLEDAVEEEVAGDGADFDAAAPGDSDNRADYSDTNNQVAGVQEGDIIKTDGEYIYHITAMSEEKHSVLRIIRADNGQVALCSETDILSIISERSENYFPLGKGGIREMMLYGDLICVIVTYRTKNDDREMPSTMTVFVDISDKAAPVIADIRTQSGHYNNARVADGVLYTISTHNCYLYYDYDLIDIVADGIGLPYSVTPDLDAIQPYIDGAPLDTDYIYVADENKSHSSTVITSVRLGGDDYGFADAKAIYNNSGTVYCSEDNLYLAATQYEYHYSDMDTESEIDCYYKTVITRIALEDGVIKPQARGTVDGNINNQFSMDEHNGYFRIVTTGYYYSVQMNKSNLYILDANLDIVGKSEDLGLTETVRSVRFMGDIGYVVTFRQTDPLYAIDLSDPSNPKVLSELKINGFSSYMHPYGDELLLGFGYDATIEGSITGLKLTMFDNSDPADVTELDTYVMPYNITEKYYNSYYLYSPALDNHKAILVNAGKNIIGIPFLREGWYYGDDGKLENDYRANYYYSFFGFEDGQIVEYAKVTLDMGTDEKGYLNWNELTSVRGLYIGDYAYIVSTGSVTAISLGDYSITDFEKFDLNIDTPSVQEGADDESYEVSGGYGDFEGGVVEGSAGMGDSYFVYDSVYYDLSEDADFVQEIIDSGAWENAAPDCYCDFEVTVFGKLLNYHSECGTFSYDNFSIKLSEEDMSRLNDFLFKLIENG